MAIGNKTLDTKITAMKKIYFIANFFVLAFLMGCTNETNDINLDALPAPKNISALATITQDNSGRVTILPRGEGVSQYEIYFGDATITPAFVRPGASVTHIYKEGVYPVRIVGTTVNGKETVVTQEVTVSFLKPTNLQVSIARVSANNFARTFAATASLEAYFQVYFGESATEIPTDFMQGEVISHTYAAVGSYAVRIVALSGGAATTVYEETIVISNPITLPIDFEAAVPPFGNFGGAYSEVVANPALGAVNGSARVGKLTKGSGSEVWAGSSIDLAGAVDFSAKKIMRMKVWSPKAGAVVKMKFETFVASDATNIEVDVRTTVAGGWEELSFNFAAINTSNAYVRVIVFFDFGNPGGGESYYFDDIELVTGSEVLALPLSFESSSLVYAFENFGGTDTKRIANPDQTSINTSATVGATTKGNGSEVWAGSSIQLANAINFSTIKKLKMKVWSPKAGIKVLMKLEILNPTPETNIEVVATSTVANGWEELSFDFPSIVNANNYRRVVFFFDFGVNGTGATYYFDDIRQSN